MAIFSLNNIHRMLLIRDADSVLYAVLLKVSLPEAVPQPQVSAACLLRSPPDLNPTKLIHLL
jgi:hypothetical protein